MSCVEVFIHRPRPNSVVSFNLRFEEKHTIARDPLEHHKTCTFTSVSLHTIESSNCDNVRSKQQFAFSVVLCKLTF